MDERWGHVDLFCGPGGFATGFEMAGFHSLLGIDIHEPSIRTYQRNHPAAATILSDIRDVSTDQISRLLASNSCSVITAGVPCEGFSMSNRNRGKYIDERNFLFLEFLRIVADLKPPYIVLENVSALTRHSDGFFKSEIQEGMRELGYIVDWRVLDAASFGVPQRRRRVFFVGRLPGWSFSWPTPSHGEAPGLKPFVTVWDALGDLPPLDNDQEIRDYSAISGRMSEYAAAMRGSQSELLNHRAPNHPPATVKMIASTEPGKPMYERFRQRIRLHPDRLSPTVVSGGIRPQFHYGHPTQPRGMSVRERARLQSFPDWYDFQGGLVQGRVQTGDAVPPFLARAIAEQIAEGLRAGRGDESEVALIGRSSQLPLFEPEPEGVS